MRARRGAWLARHRVPGVLLAAALALGCSAREALWGASVPGARLPATVTALAARGGYLDARLTGDVFDLRLIFPDRPACRNVLVHDAVVTYVRLRAFGVVEDADASCGAIGVASLAAWRDLRPRGRRSDPVPRAQATFRVFHADEAVVLVRGRFPLAAELGIAGGHDLVAWLPNAPECEGPLARGVASLESYPAGPVALALVGEAGRCPVLGLAQPLPPGRAGE